MEGKKALQIFERIMKGTLESEEKYPESASFCSLDTAVDKGVFTPSKLKIVQYLRDHSINSMTELAKELNMSKGNLSTSLKQLEQHGLVRIERDGRKKVPTVNSDHLFIIF